MSKAKDLLVKLLFPKNGDDNNPTDSELIEAIAELEAQEAKSCKNCKKQYLPPIEQLMACGHCKQLAHDNFEPKDTK